MSGLTMAVLLLASRGASAAEPSPAAVQVVRRFFDHVARRDGAGAYGLLCPRDADAIAAQDFADALDGLGGTSDAVTIGVVSTTLVWAQGDRELLALTLAVDPPGASIAHRAGWVDPLRAVPLTMDSDLPRVVRGQPAPPVATRLVVDASGPAACVDLGLPARRVYKEAVNDAVEASLQQSYETSLAFLQGARDAIGSHADAAPLLAALEPRIHLAQRHVAWRQAGRAYRPHIDVTGPTLLPGAAGALDVVTGVATNLGPDGVHALAVCLDLDPWPPGIPTPLCRWVAQASDSPASVAMFDLGPMAPGDARHFHILVPEIPDDWRGRMAFSVGSVLLVPPPPSR